MTDQKKVAEFKNQRQAAAYLDTNGRQLADLRKAALIPAYKIGNAWLYKKSDLDAFKKEEEQRKEKLLETPLFDNIGGLKCQTVFKESDLLKAPYITLEGETKEQKLDEQFKEDDFTSPLDEDNKRIIDAALFQVKCIRDQLEAALGRLNLLEINVKGFKE